MEEYFQLLEYDWILLLYMCDIKHENTEISFSSSSDMDFFYGFDVLRNILLLFLSKNKTPQSFNFYYKSKFKYLFFIFSDSRRMH